MTSDAIQHEQYDVIIIGAGPNGLTCAAYLARAGARTLVLEKRFEWGGTFATDDYSTPFLYNIGQYPLPLEDDLPPYADLGLAELGVRLLKPEVTAAFVPTHGGEPLVIRRGGDGLGEVKEAFDAASHLITPLLYSPPTHIEEVEHQLSTDEGKRILDLAHLTPAALPETVDDARAGALLRYLCAVNGFASGDQLGVLGVFALARLLSPSVVVGGTKALATAVFRAAATAGAQFRSVADVTAIQPGDGGVTVACRDGREFHGRTVVSTLDPETTFLELLDANVVPEDLRTRVDAWRLGRPGPFVAHFGIKGEPPRLATDEASQALTQVIGFEDADNVGAVIDAADRGELPNTPVGHLTVTTRYDRTQASPGPYGPLHTLRFETVAPYTHPSEDWVHARAEYRNRCWKTVAAQTSGLDDRRPLFAFADTPQDIERRFRTTRRGSLRQGALVREQTFTNRPHADCSSTHTPIPGVYIGGGGVHPGIPGSLGGGYHAAAAVCAALGLRRWWSAPEPLAGAARTG